MRKLPGWGFARRDQLAQRSSLGIGQGDAPCLVPHASSDATARVPNSSNPAITSAQTEHSSDHTVLNGNLGCSMSVDCSLSRSMALASTTQVLMSVRALSVVGKYSP